MRSPEHNEFLEQKYGSMHFFKADKGNDSILNLLCQGTYPHYHRQQNNLRILKQMNLNTFLFKKLGVFLQDSKILFVPHNEENSIG